MTVHMRQTPCQPGNRFLHKKHLKRGKGASAAKIFNGGVSEEELETKCD
jgi:hypothetical protein